jgi:hypothetical protein
MGEKLGFGVSERNVPKKNQKERSLSKVHHTGFYILVCIIN